MYRTYSQQLMKAVVEDPIIVEIKGKIIPQPTRFWILEKNLRKEISRLEEKGVIRKFSEKITENDVLFEFFKKLHYLEIEIRREILKKNYPHIYNSENPVAKRVKDVLLKTGIGGIYNFEDKPFKVKCFHLWTAYHLGDSRFQNPIGEFVLERIDV